MIRTGTALVLLAALLVAPAGCRTEERAGGRKVTLPPSFPAQVPLPPAAVLRTAQDLGEKGFNLIFESGVEPAAAEAAYRGRLEQAGWGRVAEARAEDGVFMNFRKDGISVAVGVSRAERGSAIALACAALP